MNYFYLYTMCVFLISINLLQILARKYEKVVIVIKDSSNGTTMPRGSSVVDSITLAVTTMPRGSSVVDSITLAVVVMTTGLMIDRAVGRPVFQELPQLQL